MIIDTLLFGTGVSLSSLVFTQDGSNLVVATSDGTNSVTVENWYQGPQYQIERFQDANGSILLNSQVEQLVQSSAAFGAPKSSYQASSHSDHHGHFAPEWLVTDPRSIAGRLSRHFGHQG